MQKFPNLSNFRNKWVFSSVNKSTKFVIIKIGQIWFLGWNEISVNFLVFESFALHIDSLFIAPKSKFVVTKTFFVVFRLPQNCKKLSYFTRKNKTVDWLSPVILLRWGWISIEEAVQLKAYTVFEVDSVYFLMLKILNFCVAVSIFFLVALVLCDCVASPNLSYFFAS